MTRSLSFVVARDDIERSRCLSVETAELGDGDLLLRIDAFALTANNVTYAEFGDRMQYWNFFPTEAGWGCIPAWGFAEVVESAHAGFAPGERVYGFLPMASHVVLRPDRVGDDRFVDASAHRLKLPAAYNLYSRVDRDPAHDVRSEAHQALLRPVFMTSFLIDDFLFDEGFFGAEGVVLSSASSKTAIGLAHELKARASHAVTGLTSAANRAFVDRLGLYDTVVAYEELASLPRRPTVYVDFAGSADLRRAVHEHYADALKYSCAVGFTQRAAADVKRPLTGPAPSLFFAPDRLRKRALDWGRNGIDTRFAAHWQRFLPGAEQWLKVSRGRGGDAVGEVYAALLGGQVPPDRGHVLSLA